MWLVVRSPRRCSSVNFSESRLKARGRQCVNTSSRRSQSSGTSFHAPYGSLKSLSLLKMWKGYWKVRISILSAFDLWFLESVYMSSPKAESVSPLRKCGSYSRFSLEWYLHTETRVCYNFNLLGEPGDGLGGRLRRLSRFGHDPS